MTIGESIRERRKIYDIEQQELASRIGIPKQRLNSIETGQSMPTVNILIALADTLHCTTDELLGREEIGKRRKSKWTSHSPQYVRC